MNNLDRKRARMVIDGANELMNAGPNDGRNVLNTDVIEALIGDLGKIMNNQEPTEIAELLARPSTREAQS